jgi:hypothetical protein
VLAIRPGLSAFLSFLESPDDGRSMSWETAGRVADLVGIVAFVGAVVVSIANREHWNIAESDVLVGGVVSGVVGFMLLVAGLKERASPWSSFRNDRGQSATLMLLASALFFILSAVAIALH